jgi:hypothetical protein
MKSKLFKSVFVLASLALFSLPAMAESFTMSVPFSFRVGTKIFPAGSYSIENSGSMLLLRGAGTGTFINTVPSTVTLETPLSGNVVFAKTATGEMLESVKFPSGAVQSILPSGRTESLGVALARP